MSSLKQRLVNVDDFLERFMAWQKYSQGKPSLIFECKL